MGSIIDITKSIARRKQQDEAAAAMRPLPVQHYPAAQLIAMLRTVAKAIAKDPAQGDIATEARRRLPGVADDQLRAGLEWCRIEAAKKAEKQAEQQRLLEANMAAVLPLAERFELTFGELHAESAAAGHPHLDELFKILEAKYCKAKPRPQCKPRQRKVHPSQATMFADDGVEGEPCDG